MRIESRNIRPVYSFVLAKMKVVVKDLNQILTENLPAVWA